MRKYIGAFGNWHVYAFAHFGYQIQAISILSSIFMTVVLALERYLAITKPIEYHNAIQERIETTEFKARNTHLSYLTTLSPEIKDVR